MEGKRGCSGATWDGADLRPSSFVRRFDGSAAAFRARWDEQLRQLGWTIHGRWLTGRPGLRWCGGLKPGARHELRFVESAQRVILCLAPEDDADLTWGEMQKALLGWTDADDVACVPARSVLEGGEQDRDARRSPSWGPASTGGASSTETVSSYEVVVWPGEDACAAVDQPQHQQQQRQPQPRIAPATPPQDPRCACAGCQSEWFERGWICPEAIKNRARLNRALRDLKMEETARSAHELEVLPSILEQAGSVDQVDLENLFSVEVAARLEDEAEVDKQESKAREARQMARSPEAGGGGGDDK